MEPQPALDRKPSHSPSHSPSPSRSNSANGGSGRPKRSELQEVEREGRGGQPWMLTGTEAKLLGIAGIGFFLDAYDLFIINPVATMLQYRLYGGEHLPAHLEGFVKAGANIGSVIGQFVFGYLADALGRQRVYGKGTHAHHLRDDHDAHHAHRGRSRPTTASSIWGVWRIVLGVGVGGDYPMSASVTSDRANIRKRGTMLTYIFSMQGWGSLVGSLIVIILLAIYKGVIDGEGKISKVDGVWRIAVGLSLVPAFGTLYQRLTLGESTRYEKSKALDNGNADEPRTLDFVRHFSQWENAKLLFATSASWFLLDIAFYGINLNQNVVLQQIGFDGSSGSPWHRLFRVSTGNIIITVLGFVPGYYATLFTIEILGRKWIQIQGFLLSALFLGILAGKFYTLSTVQFIVCFAFLQFFFNFGANTTTYCYPAEVFPTRYKAFAHGISAASGKAGAIISALAFNQLSKKIGTPACLWIFFGCCLGGAVVSLLLPEVKGRDADVILAQQIEERRRREGGNVDVD
ncbi:MFS inorganic phosphate transporter [Coprinellus micaceus]|uniref:MFS inorganic phosphate transporter n=1 Tax=Coprinellus micaceus TaxID=71717 RepID=A0A4Y7T0G1_COPMI|nr:MFS inorganic phosphate transporter [Coprinellus micaceus]